MSSSESTSVVDVSALGTLSQEHSTISDIGGINVSATDSPMIQVIFKIIVIKCMMK